jgi:chaperonin GroEL (HSP60 family)
MPLGLSATRACRRCVHARQSQALSFCIVPAGGVALVRASALLDTLKLDGDEQVGVAIVRRACEEPVRQIVLNCGTEGTVVAATIKSNPASQLQLQCLHGTV